MTIPSSPTLSGESTPLEIREIVQRLASVVQRRDYRAAVQELLTSLSVRYGCERASLGWVRGRRVSLQTISHTQQLDPKGSLARTVTHAMEEAVDQGARLRYPQVEPTPDDGPRILRCHTQLAAQYGAASICSIPLFESDACYGVITLEWGNDPRVDTADLDAIEATLRVIAPVLRLKWRDQRWWIAKTWDAVDHFRRGLFVPGHDSRKILAVACVVFVAIAVLGHGEHRVKARAHLEGSTQRVAVAPFAGYVGEAEIRAGDVVSQGQVLCTLDQRELELDLERWESEREKLVKQRRRALAEMNAVDLRVISAQIDQVEASRALAHYKLERTDVTSPLRGVVVEGDLSQSIGAPVERGEILFEIAPLDSYRLILEVDERDIRAVEVGHEGRVRLTALPNDPIPFTITRITPVSTPRDGRNFFRVEGELETPLLDQLRPGMRGHGKIEIGSRRYVWLWTHDLLDWARLQFWRWLP